MKKILAMLALMAPISAFGATVITYDDGSTYTLAEGEKVFVTDGRLFGLTQTDGVYSFGEKLANTKRDFVETETWEDFPMGSERWCELYEPWHEGLTFRMVWWQRVCPQAQEGF